MELNSRAAETPLARSRVRERRRLSPQMERAIPFAGGATECQAGRRSGSRRAPGLPQTEACCFSPG